MANQRIKYNSEIECVIYDFGDRYYYKIDTSIIHRLDGPAIERANGNKFWYKNNKLYRADGPAVEYPNGNKEYWINEKLIDFSGTDEEWIIKNLLE